MYKVVLFIIILVFSTNLHNNDLKSESYILMDYTTGEILKERNMNVIMEPASLTKIMTAYIVFDYIKNNQLSMDDIVPITSNAVRTARRTNSARSFYEERHTVILKDVLKGLIVHSGNDAAITLAELISGSEEAFSQLMNEYAKNIGMKNTKFNNASGLPTNDHYSTAYDLAILSRSLIANFPELYSYYFAMQSYIHNEIYQPNRNRLIFRDNRFDGIKTGWTRSAGYCYATSIIENGQRFIIITMNAEKPEDRFDDALALTEYATTNYKNVILTQKNKTIQGLEYIPIYYSNNTLAKIKPSQTIIKTFKNNDIEKIIATVNIKKSITAPALKNDIVGEIIFKIDNKEIGKTNIVLDENQLIGNWRNYLIDYIYLKTNK